MTPPRGRLLPGPSARWIGVLAFGLLSCGGSEDAGPTDVVPPVDAVSSRPTDGLVGDGDLRAVVERQVLRDASFLVEALGHERPAVRARAALALASVSAPEAVGPLTALLADPSADVRRDAAFALGRMGVSEAAPALAEALGREAETAVRASLAEALAFVPAQASISALLAWDPAEDEEVWRARALARLGAVYGAATPAALDTLAALLGRDDPGAREAAAWYFGAAAPHLWSGHAATLRSILDALPPGDASARHLLLALGALGQAEDGARLLSWAAGATDWRTRVAAVAMLATRAPTPEIAPALLSALDDLNDHVSATAAASLAGHATFGDGPAQVQAWIAANPDRSASIGPLLVLLARAGEGATLFSLLDGPASDDGVLRGLAIQALAYLPGLEGLERIEAELLSAEPRSAGDATEALVTRWDRERGDAALRERYLTGLSRALRTGTPRAANWAGPMLADPLFRSLGGVDTLVAALGSMDPATQADALVAVVASIELSGDESAEPALRRVLGWSDPALRRAAAQALTSLLGRSVPSADAPTPPVQLDWPYLDSLGTAPRWVLETAKGRIVVRLFPELAPQTVQTIARLAEEGRYDGNVFHRVLPGFVAQGGDFARGDGYGHPGFTLTTELTPLPFRRGSVGMASTGRDTEGSQFFLFPAAQPQLDGSYTSFGWVEEGIEVVDALQPWDRIVRTSVERGG